MILSVATRALPATKIDAAARTYFYFNHPLPEMSKAPSSTQVSGNMEVIRLRTGAGISSSVFGTAAQFACDSERPARGKAALPGQFSSSAFHRTHALLPKPLKAPPGNLPLLIHQRQVMPAGVTQSWVETARCFRTMHSPSSAPCSVTALCSTSYFTVAQEHVTAANTARTLPSMAQLLPAPIICSSSSERRLATRDRAQGRPRTSGPHDPYGQVEPLYLG